MKRSAIFGLSSIVLGCALSLTAADNIILFIGDGMGWDHVKAGRVLVKGSSATPLGFEGLGNIAQSITVLPNGTITDSATAGTALATGYQHPANGFISMGANNSIKTTILELATAKGLRTGIITTDDIGGATPGAFGAHEPDRTRTTQIRNDYFWYDTVYPHNPSLPTLLLGGGFNDSATTYVEAAKGLGYAFAETTDDLSAISQGKVLGLFGSAWAPMATMVSPSPTQPLLSEMVSKALSLLQGESGFFLMVESANIDKMSHSNDRNFVFEVAELEAAVQSAVDWKATRSGDNTLILVTADHETGGLTVPDQDLPVGTVPSMEWSSVDHSIRNVPVFATWPLSLAGLTVDNTEVFFLLEDYLNISSGGAAPTLTDLTVLGITETSATVQWDTVEPSSTALFSETDVIAEDASRVNRHTVVLGGLTAATLYQFTAASTDIAGNTGSAVVSFTTKAPDYSARIVTEPVVHIGVLSGTIAGVAVPGDGLTQVVTEAVSGAGSRVSVEYALHTAALPTFIDSLTLQGVVAWSDQDGAAEDLIAEVRVAVPGGGYGWQQITLPFQAVPPSAYVDASGDVLLRFSDTASIKRERKDTLKVDYLVGEVLLDGITPVLPTAPAELTAASVTDTSVTLSWQDSADETSYLIWRYTVESGWVVAAEKPAGTVTFEDIGVTAGTTYTYAIRALSADGYADSGQLTVQTVVVLVPPQNLIASVTKGVIAINLTWTDSNNIETAYEILRGTTPDGNFESLATVLADVTSYRDATVTRGIKYYYKVRALKNAEIGPVSKTVYATAR